MFLTVATTANHKMGNRKKSYKKKKARFHGNRYTNGRTGSESTHDSDTDVSQSVEVADQQKESTGIENKKATASGTTLQHLTQEKMEFDCDDEPTGFRFVDCLLFVQFVSSLQCPDCKK